jgi:SanA protein
MGFLRRLFVACARIVWMCAVMVGIANWSVISVGNRRLINYESLLPRGATALVLGTSPRLPRGGGPNPFFEGRMETAARLYHAGYIAHLVLSGDNRNPEYNEPAAMKEALAQRGVPESVIRLDPGGFRTMESILRAREVFHLEKPVLITDDFHLSRALFLATATKLDAVGFASPPIPWKQSYKTRIREWFSRVLAVKEIYQRATAETAPNAFSDSGWTGGIATTSAFQLSTRS